MRVRTRANPCIELPTPEQAAKSKELRAEIAKVQTVLDTPTPALATAQSQWEQDIKAAEAKWTVLQPSHYVSQGGATLKLLPDGSLLAGGKNPDADSYEISASTDLDGDYRRAPGSDERPQPAGRRTGPRRGRQFLPE